MQLPPPTNLDASSSAYQRHRDATRRKRKSTSLIRGETAERCPQILPRRHIVWPLRPHMSSENRSLGSIWCVYCLLKGVRSTCVKEWQDSTVWRSACLCDFNFPSPFPTFLPPSFGHRCPRRSCYAGACTVVILSTKKLHYPLSVFLIIRVCRKAG